MDNVVMSEEEVISLVKDILEGASDITSAREGILNLIDNPSYNISDNLKSVFLNITKSDQNLVKFKEEMRNSNEETVNPVIIPETPINVFYHKLLANKASRITLREDRAIIPYVSNNKHVIYALMGKALDYNLSFILANDFDSETNNVNINFVISSMDKIMESNQFYSILNNIMDDVYDNHDYLQELPFDLKKVVQVFDASISNNSKSDFNIGLTSRERGSEVIVTLDDKTTIDRLTNLGVNVNDNKIRINDMIVDTLGKIEVALSNRNVLSTEYDIENGYDKNNDTVLYSLYDVKKNDGTDIKTSLYQENNGSNVYMSTVIDNSNLDVSVSKNYLFTSKNIFSSSILPFLDSSKLVERKGASIIKEDSIPFTCTFSFDDKTDVKWVSNTEADSYKEVVSLYSQLDKIPNMESKNNQNMSIGSNSQVLVKSNKDLPPVLPSQEKSNPFNNSGFSNTFLFVTLVAIEIVAITFGLFLLVK